VRAASQVMWVSVSTKSGLYGWSWIPAYSSPAVSAIAAMRAAMARPPVLESTLMPNATGRVMVPTIAGGPAGVAVRERRRTIAIVAEWWSIEVLHNEVSASGGRNSMTRP
jgi:hypothetical protein